MVISTSIGDENVWMWPARSRAAGITLQNHNSRFSHLRQFKSLCRDRPTRGVGSAPCAQWFSGRNISQSSSIICTNTRKSINIIINVASESSLFVSSRHACLMAQHYQAFFCHAGRWSSRLAITRAEYRASYAAYIRIRILFYVEFCGVLLVVWAPIII